MLENKYGADSSCGHEEFPRCQGKREAVLAFLRWTIASNFRFSRRHPAAAKWSVCTNRAKSFGWVSRGSILSSEIKPRYQRYQDDLFMKRAEERGG